MPMKLVLAHEVETLVGRTVGDGKVHATVTADMDFDKISTSQESFDPDQQVVRSTQTVDEKNDSKDASKDSSVSVANNFACNGGRCWRRWKTPALRTERGSEETTNFEIGKTTPQPRCVKAARLKSFRSRYWSTAFIKPIADGKTDL